ncbi:MAG: hypothetical protein A2144_02950 [Chloroflexi bacterium RBG_16_50_9]|nr:MAG: hypothetical protein A2144_02950 [Chloroflexi bacterium RBG_16_50_9]
MKTVKKALDILEVFLNTRREISISELASITGQNISTVHGILHELIRRGYIRQPERRGKYSLGLKISGFNGALSKTAAIVEIAKPFMVELSKQVNETVNIAVRNGNYAINISIIHSPHRLRVVTDDNSGIPLYCTAVGKIFLAGMTNKELVEYFDNEKLVSSTPNTVTDARLLKKQIQVIRDEGVAYDDEECDIGIRNVAAPVKDYYGNIAAAIGVLGPSIRLSLKRMKEITPVVTKYATDISGVMGYTEE